MYDHLSAPPRLQEDSTVTQGPSLSTRSAPERRLDRALGMYIQMNLDQYRNFQPSIFPIWWPGQSAGSAGSHTSILGEKNATNGKSSQVYVTPWSFVKAVSTPPGNQSIICSYLCDPSIVLPYCSPDPACRHPILPPRSSASYVWI